MTVSFDIGDHVTDDEDDEDRTLLVIGTSPKDAAEYYLDDDMTVADYNTEYPDDDTVVEVCYPQASDVDVSRCKTYAFPASRLSLEAAIHTPEPEVES